MKSPNFFHCLLIFSFSEEVSGKQNQQRLFMR